MNKVITNKNNLLVLYEDNHIIAVNKRVSDIIQSDKTNDTPLSEIIKSYLKEKYSKPGNVFLGVVHRIDRPTSGVVIFAKTSKALKRLNNMFKMGEIEKSYLAITKNKPDKKQDTIIHWLKKNNKTNKSTHFIKKSKDSKKAVLHYNIIKKLESYFLIKVKIDTGRHHQIRCQLSAIGCPIKGDLKYGAKRSNKNGGIDLHARSVKFIHPVLKQEIFIKAPYNNSKIWSFID